MLTDLKYFVTRPMLHILAGSELSQRAPEEKPLYIYTITISSEQVIIRREKLQCFQKLTNNVFLNCSHT
jgi:hypothetical protein